MMPPFKSKLQVLLTGVNVAIIAPDVFFIFKTVLVYISTFVDCPEFCELPNEIVLPPATAVPKFVANVESKTDSAPQTGNEPFDFKT